MYGLTIRWSLQAAPADVAQTLREYVAKTSLARFSGMAGLQLKVWRMHEGNWFEGTYVFDTAAARDAFAAGFAEQAATAPGSVIIGSAPSTIEAYEVVAIAEGGAGFRAGPGPGV
jgi:hypothetical protein